MPIVHFRVDQRMIHGQVAITWTKYTDPNHIILANDDVPKNPLQQSILKLAAPKQVRLSMVSVDKAVNYINRGIKENERIFLLTQNIMDAKRLFEGCGDNLLVELNIGNMTHKSGSIKLNDRIFATEEEVNVIKWFVNNNLEINFQMMPTDMKENFKNII